MIKIADILPIFFSPLKNGFQRDIDYIQRFYVSDNIHIQIISTEGDVPYAYIYDKVNNKGDDLIFNTYQINEDETLYYINISNLPDSIYAISINGNESEMFEVTSSEDILENTTLVKCSHENNNAISDNIFWIDGDKIFIELRLELGFRPDGYSSKVDNEQFRNQMQEIVELYSVPYDSYSLTIGSSSGVPYWFIRFINMALSLSFFEIDGIMYMRSGNSVPEKNAISEDAQMFIASIAVERKNNSQEWEPLFVDALYDSDNKMMFDIEGNRLYV